MSEIDLKYYQNWTVENAGKIAQICNVQFGNEDSEIPESKFYELLNKFIIENIANKLGGNIFLILAFQNFLRQEYSSAKSSSRYKVYFDPKTKKPIKDK